MFGDGSPPNMSKPSGRDDATNNELTDGDGDSTSEDIEDSDEDDIFKLQAAPVGDSLRQSFKCRWLLAAEELTEHLRDDVLAPLDPRETGEEKNFTDMSTTRNTSVRMAVAG